MGEAVELIFRCLWMVELPASADLNLYRKEADTSVIRVEPNTWAHCTGDRVQIVPSETRRSMRSGQ